MPSTTASPASSRGKGASSTAGVSNAGVAVSASGDRVIPASVRADGSQRREIRVRPGYRPPEDVEVYKNRTAEAFRNRGKGTGFVPGAEGVDEDGGGNGGAVAAQSQAQTKNAKRREARKRAKATGEADGGADGREGEGEDGCGATEDGDGVRRSRGEGTDQIEKGNVTKPTEKGVNGGVRKTASMSAAPPKTDEEKQAKKLRKKLREARELQAKRNKGEGLLQEQFEKVIRIQELLRQLEGLGLKEEDDEGTAAAPVAPT